MAYKTPEELGLQQVTYDGLVQLADELERGVIQHENFFYSKKGAPRAFNMNHWCGAVCCIRGWLAHRGQLGSAEEECAARLDRLFYPYAVQDYAVFDDISAEQAAKAIRSFLVTGCPDKAWIDAVGEPR